jgi:hypothetical protein
MIMLARVPDKPNEEAKQKRREPFGTKADIFLAT